MRKCSKSLESMKKSKKNGECLRMYEEVWGSFAKVTKRMLKCVNLHESAHIW